MQDHYSTMLGARSTDLEFYTRVMLAVVVCGLSFGLPFAIYHLIWGNPWLSAILLPVIVLQLVTVYLLRRNGFSRVSATIIAVLQTAATTFFAFAVPGFSATYWLFASGVANYYIVDRNTALLMNAVACAVVAVFALDVLADAVRYCASFAMVNIFLYSFARQLEKKNAQLDRMLTVDPLTLAGNRTALEEALKRVKGQFERYGVPASLIMIDLDHFKRINDTRGHNEGDRVLAWVASTIQKRLRPTDGLYRFGGEEFIVITENTRLDQAAFLAEDIRRKVESGEGDGHARLMSGMTVSLGLAQLRSGESADGWVGRADRAMYKAKAMGRNWICFDADVNADHVGKSAGASPL